MKILEEVELRPDIFSVINSLAKEGDNIAKILQGLFYDCNDVSNYDWMDIDDDFNLVKFQLKDDKHLGKVRLGRIVRDILTKNEIEFKDSNIEKFVNSYRAILSDNSTTFEIWKGDQIIQAYNTENYLKKDTGSLGSSCMNGAISQLALYIDNPESINILVLKRDGKISGRALLWDIQEKSGYTKYMDRIYAIQDHEVILFKKWAIKNHYFSYDIDYEASEVPIVTHLDHWKFDEYPYLDTFAHVDESGNFQNFFKEGKGKFYSVGQEGLILCSKEIIKDPITNEKEFYWNNYNQNFFYYDNFLSEEYLDSDCVSEIIRSFGSEVKIKTHKNNLPKIEKVVSNCDIENRLSIYILPYLDKFLTTKGLCAIREIGWDSIRFNVKKESGEMSILVYYGSRYSESFGEFGEIYIKKAAGKISVELMIFNLKTKKKIIAKNMSDLFHNKLNELFSDPKVDVPVKSTRKIMKFKSFMNKLLHRLN